MTLPAAVNDTHPAATDFFKQLIVTQPPEVLGSRNRREQRRKIILWWLVGLIQSRPDETGETESARQTCHSATIGTWRGRSARHAGIRQTRPVHGRIDSLG